MRFPSTDAVENDDSTNLSFLLHCASSSSRFDWIVYELEKTPAALAKQTFHIDLRLKRSAH